MWLERWHQGLLVLLSLAWLLTVLWSCKKDKQPTNTELEPNLAWANHSPSATYLGNNACVSCHQDIASRYSTSDKGLAIQPVDLNHIPENLAQPPVFDPKHGLYYQMVRQGTGLAITEFRRRGKDTIHRLTLPISQVIGSGRQTRSYLLNHNGYITEAPITWYSRKGIFDLSPGYEKGRNSRFARPIGAECLFCHASEFQATANSINHFNAEPQTIGCESCHGPGSLHVAKHQAKADTSGIDRSIVNPKHLAVQLQLDVCRQCHLEGIAVPKEGKTIFDFRPGNPLKDVQEVLIPTNGNKAQFGFASHAERLQQSKCFIASAGKLNCNTCHHAHENSPKGLVAATFYDGKCVSCHTGGHQACASPEAKAKKASCISCHMAQGKVTDIPHVNSSDHYIRRQIEKGAKGKQAEINPSRLSFINFTDSTPPSDKTIGQAYLNYYETVDKAPEILNSVKKYLAALPPAGQLKWHYYTGTPAPPQAWPQDPMSLWFQANLLSSGASKLTLLEKAAKAAPYHLDIQAAWAKELIAGGKPSEGKQVLEDLLKKNNRHPEALNNLGFILLQQGKSSEAVILLEQSVTLAPDYTLARENYTSALVMTGQQEAAKAQLGILIAQDTKNPKYKAMLSALRKSNH